MASPLAKRLFNIDGVTNVFFGLDFVTVTKSEEADWETVKPQTFEAIMNFYASGVRGDGTGDTHAGAGVRELG